MCARRGIKEPFVSTERHSRASTHLALDSARIGMHQLYLNVKRDVKETYPPKNGVIVLWPNTRVVKCKYCVSQKRNEAKWFNVVLTFIFKFTARS